MIFNHLIYDHLSFDQPRFLWLLLLLIPALLLMIYHYGKQRKVFFAFFQKYDETEKASLMRRLKGHHIIASFFFMLFLVCIIVALAGPRWGYRNVIDNRRGLDLVFAIDVSRSMNVQDAVPSRLARAVLLAQELVRETPGIRFAAAVGKGSGVLALPLTDDSEAVLAFLNGLSSSVITSRGTNLENLIAAAVSGFVDSFPTHRIIIVFSDGEAHSGNIDPLLETLKDADIELISVALGLEEGGPIPAGNDVLRNPDGSIVISSLHPALLMNLAEHSGGMYIDGSKTDALARLKNHLESLLTESVSSGFRREHKSWWHLFVVLALASYAFSRWLELGWRKKQ